MKKNIERIIRVLFSVADVFFHRKKYIVFSARAAKDYADNSKVLFERFLLEDSDKAFFFTKKKSVLNSIPKNGIYAYSFRAVLILLRSKILVFTHGSGDFFPYFPKKHSNRIFIQLFHAIAVKKVGISGSPSEIKEVDKWDYFLVSSEFESQFIKDQYGLTDDRILNLGHPRNDIIIQSSLDTTKKSTKRVLYAPTFRDNDLTKLFPFPDADLLSLDAFLREKDIEIIIRLHINDEAEYQTFEIFKELKNINFVGSNIVPTVNDYLHTVDMLISDYSSITLDYLLLNRPIAYIPYDYEQYEEERGFSFDYHEHRAGPLLSSQDDLRSFLDMNKDPFEDKRTELRNLFHKHQDGKSTERLFSLIQKLEQND